MSILGSLIIDLQARTQSFVDGMSGAAKTARTTGHEIESAFSQLGDIAASALAPFGEIGEAVSGTLEKMGVSAGAAITSFGRLGGAAGLGAGLIAGAGAAVLALDAGAIALAIHTAESAAKLGEMSQKAGISSQAFAGLSVAGKAVGVDNETLAKALGFMNANAVKAAITADGTATSFSRLGVQVKNASGGMRDTGDIFLDVVSKISGLQGTEQGFFAKAIFGKGGLAVIPLINEGVDKIREKMELAKEFGLGDPQAVASSQQFKETISELQDELEGAALRLTKQLLPALQYVADRISKAFKTGALQEFVDKLATVVKETFTLGYALAHLSDLHPAGGKVGAAFAEGFGGGIVEALKVQEKALNAFDKMTAGDSEFANLTAERHKFLREAITRESQNTAANVKYALGGISWQQYTTDIDNFRKGLEGKPKDAFSWADGILGALKKPKPSGGIDLSSGKGDEHLAAINKTIGVLGAQAKAELGVAAAATESMAAQKLAAAQGEAGTIITRLLADADKATGAERQKLIALIQRETVAVNALTAAKQVAKDAASIGTELQKETLNYEKQISALTRVGEAYAKGADAVAAAEINKQLEGDNQAVAQLQEEFGRLASTAGVSGTALASIARDLAAAKSQLELHREQLTQIRELKYGDELKEQAAAMRGMTPFLNNLNDAYLMNAEAVMDAKVAIQVYNYELSHKGATQDQIAQVTQQFKLQALQAQHAADAQEAGQFSLGKLYDDSVVKLERVREVIQQSGQSTLLVDAALFDSQARLIRLWDDQAAKAGKFRDRLHSVFNEIVLQGREAGEAISRAFVSAFDGAETELAKLLVTGKGNFVGVLQSLEQSIVKVGIQKAIGGLVANIPGLSNIATLLGGGPQLGTQANPMYAIVLNAETNIGAGSSPDISGGGIGGPNITGVGGIGLPNAGIFAQSLNTMSAAQNVFAGRMGTSWFGIASMFKGALGLMTSLFHIHTASVIAGHAAQTGAAITSQTAQTAAASSGAAARGNIGLAEHLKAVFRHAAGAAAAVFHKVMEALPFPLDVIIAPVAAAGAFAGVLAWGAIGSAAQGALVPEDMLMMTHKDEMVLPTDISTGLRGIIRANEGNVPSVSQFAPSTTSTGRGEQFHAHVHMGDVTALDSVGVAEQIKKAKTQVLKEVRRGFQTGFLNPRRLARI